MFLFLQEYCKFKNTEDGAFPSVYIGLKDKLSGIHKVIMDSTALLIQLLQSYKEKLQEFSKDGETPGLVTSLEGLAGELGVRKGEQNGRRECPIFRAVLWLDCAAGRHLP